MSGLFADCSLSMRAATAVKRLFKGYPATMALAPWLAWPAKGRARGAEGGHVEHRDVPLGIVEHDLRLVVVPPEDDRQPVLHPGHHVGVREHMVGCEHETRALQVARAGRGHAHDLDHARPRPSYTRPN
jgi:hypothetical protein